MQAPTSNNQKVAAVHKAVDHQHSTTNTPESHSHTTPPMALDLNVPPEEAEEEDDPLGGLAHGHDLPPCAGAHPLGDGHGAPSFDLNMAAYKSG